MEDMIRLLKEKLPKDNLHSGMLISIVKNRKINDKQRLLDFLQNQENVCREWLAKNKGAAMSPKRRDYSRKLEEVQAMKDIAEKI